MASIKVYPGDDIIKQLQQMADIDNIAPKCISAAAPVVKKALKKNLKSHRKTGDMEKSITNTKPKKNKQGWYAKVYFSDEDRKGVSNSLKANIIENGKKGQAAHPFVTKTKNDCQSDVSQAMQDKFNEVTGL